MIAACTSRSCANRHGLCPVSLLCGCVCHAAAQQAVSVPPTPADYQDEALSPSEIATVLLAGALAGQGHTFAPHGDAVALVQMLERNGLRIVQL